MNYYGSKYEDYIHAHTNYDRFHVIHEIVNYYFDKNENFIQYGYAIIEFYVNNIGHIETNAFFPYIGNHVESNDFMPENVAQDYTIFKIRNGPNIINTKSDNKCDGNE